MTYRTWIATFFAASMLLAQSAPKQHNTTATATHAGVITERNSTTTTNTNTLTIPTTGTQTFWGDGTTTNWETSGGLVVAGTVGTWTTGSIVCNTSGGCAVVNDHNTGLETRTLDDKGPTLTQVDYSAVELKDAELAPTAYLKLAKEVKLDSAPVDEAQMLQTIHDHHFRVYDFDKVDNYLYRQALKMGTRVRWVWKPAREADLKQVQSAGYSNTKGIVYGKLYAQRIPGRILEDLRCVLAEMPEAIMLVSDFEAVKPDPFLAITTPKLLAEGKLWIVDRWDEPGFEDGGKVGGKPAGDVVRNLAAEQLALVH
jgi:hypothetical protein